MFSWTVLEPGSYQHQLYTAQRRSVFPGLHISEEDTDIDVGVYYNARLVGGASFSRVRSLTEDPDLRRHWKIIGPRAGTRVSRLWTEPDSPIATLHQILQALDSLLAEKSFVYGILSGVMSAKGTAEFQLPR